MHRPRLTKPSLPGGRGSRGPAQGSWHTAAPGDLIALPAPHGQWQLREKLATRRQFTVWLASDVATGYRCALRGFAPGPESARRAAREVALQRRAASQATMLCGPLLQSALGPVSRQPLALGATLAHVIDGPRGTFAASGTLRLLAHLARMAQAVARAHQAGVLHRDVKPANMVFLRHGSNSAALRLSDFNLAVRTASHCNDGAGTLAYLAPEVMGGAPHTEAADVFSLGASLCELAVGLTPYEGNTEEETAKSLLCQVPAVSVTDLRLVLGASSLPATHAAAVVHWVAAATHREPASRPSASRLAADIGAWAANQSTDALCAT